MTSTNTYCKPLQCPIHTIFMSISTQFNMNSIRTALVIFLIFPIFFPIFSLTFLCLILLAAPYTHTALKSSHLASLFLVLSSILSSSLHPLFISLLFLLRFCFLFICFLTLACCHLSFSSPSSTFCLPLASPFLPPSNSHHHQSS